MFAGSRLPWVLSLFLSVCCAACPSDEPALDETTAAASVTRRYYVAAEEVDWDYAPQHMNMMEGRPFNDDENVFVGGDGQYFIGSKYRKAVYHEYTDASFKRRMERKGADKHLGILGPIIRGVVGDRIEVVFKNNASYPYSIHPHGVFYEKNAEGAGGADGTSQADKADDAVEPGDTFTYVWNVPERAGPGPNDPSSIVWLYHSHVHSIMDSNAGLVGAIVITRADAANEDARPNDVDREFFSFFTVFDENVSHYLDENITHFAPSALSERIGPDGEGESPDQEAFEESNLMHSMNGYVYANGPMPMMYVGERVRWYLLALGTEVDLHTPHWHGNTVLYDGHRTDVIELLPASMKTVDMVPDSAGMWMYHCHVNDHIAAGMVGMYQVHPAAHAK